MEINSTGKSFMAATLMTLVIAVFTGCQPAGTGDGAVTSGKPLKDAQASVFQDVTGDDAKALIAGTAGLTILDVRTPEEYAEGHLENAMNVDLKAPSFGQELGKLDKNKPYMVYCRSGKRSMEAANIMKELGFINVNNLTGGITQWQAEGGAVVR